MWSTVLGVYADPQGMEFRKKYAAKHPGVINMDLERLIDAPGLDGDPLPRMADPGWAMELHVYFGCKPYWD